MIKGNSVSVATIKESDLVKRSSSMTIGEGQAALNSYLSQGYAVYNITAAGGFSGIISAGGSNPKIVCVFTSIPAGPTYPMQISYMGSKTSVIILGVVVNNTTDLKVTAVQSGNFTVSYSISDSRDYRASGLTYSYCNAINHTVSSVIALYGLIFYNCNNQQVYTMLPYYFNIQFTQILFTATTGIGFDTKTVIRNSRVTLFNMNSFNTAGSSLGSIYNVVFELENTNFTFNWNASINNVYIAFTDVSTRGSVSGSIQGLIYIHDIYAGRAYLTAATVKHISMTDRLNPDNNNYLISLKELLLTTIDFTALAALTHYTVDALITSEYRVNTGMYKTVRNYYILDFIRNFVVPDEVKYINPAVLWIVKRTDIEAILAPASPKKIKDGILYENDGSTPYSYLQDENFIIIAANGSDSQAFLWYNGEIFKTIWSEPMPGATYTITACYQFWKMEPPVRVRNVYDIDDSPMEGTITFNNLDNEVSA